MNACLAQLVEHLTCNEDVIGSNPIAGSRSFYMRQCLSRPKEGSAKP